MARLALIMAMLLSALPLAGCLEDVNDELTNVVGGLEDPLRGALDDVGFASSEPLWYNPETFPHPMFNFSTLTNPPAGPRSKWLEPMPKAALPSTIKGLDWVARSEGAPGGDGMSAIGSLAILPARVTSLVDLSDPARPTTVGQFNQSTRTSDTIVYPDGRIVAVVGSSTTLFAVDITNPSEPTELSQVKPPRGAHKVDVVPGTPIVYNANSKGGDGDPAFGITGDVPQAAKGVTEIYDLSDPTNFVEVQQFQNGYGCHRIYFYVEPSEDYHRAICAGIEMTQLWDIKDPRHPVVLVNIPVWHGRPGLPANAVPPVTFSHFAILSADHSTLIVGDEMGGGAAMACTASVTQGTRTVSAPTGALWFYDVSDEKNPVLKGWLSPPAPTASNPNGGKGCTAHHGRLVPDPAGERDLLAMGFYGAGVVLVDFTDAANPFIVDQWNDGANVWEAWYYNGYIITGDIGRGLDVLRFQ